VGVTTASEALVIALTNAIDKFMEQFPDVTVAELLEALEKIRHVVTEETINAS